jgi:hypothetical protein
MFGRRPRAAAVAAVRISGQQQQGAIAMHELIEAINTLVAVAAKQATAMQANQAMLGAMQDTMRNIRELLEEAAEDAKAKQ